MITKRESIVVPGMSLPRASLITSSEPLFTWYTGVPRQSG